MVNNAHRKFGVLLLQVGSPDAPTASSCRRFLREFLNDPRVIDLPTFLRWPLVNLVIAPLRAPKSAHAYSQIWMKTADEKSESPLRYHTQALCSLVSENLGKDVQVRYGMAYGNPHLSNVIHDFQKQNITDLILFPLFPQYASATTGSILEACFKHLGKEFNIPSVRVIPPFFEENFFLEALIRSAKALKAFSQADHFLFSFHGLPESHIQNSDRQGHCLKAPHYLCCEKMQRENAFCYRAHCIQTSRRIALRAQIPDSKMSISFQSRLGPTPWLMPYTDQVIAELPKKGIKKLVVFTPSFVADCLETLEEIQIRGRASFLTNGGESFWMVPAPNAEPQFAMALANHIQKFIF